MAAGGGNAIRGSRVGAGPMGEAERGEAAPRQRVVYFCAHEHESVITFAAPAEMVGEAAFQAVRQAVESLDLRHHTGVHPRIGAADVVPLVPVRGVTLEDCARTEQRYERNTPVLVTRHTDTAGNAIEIVDFCPYYRRLGRSYRPVAFVRIGSSTAGVVPDAGSHPGARTAYA